MNKKKTSLLFLALIVLQGFHSIEEYIGKLWENFPPATFLCGLVSENLETGFLIINYGMFIFGILAWFFIIRKDRIGSSFFLWFWIFIEIVNGIGHPLWSLIQKEYTPGVLTSPVLLIFSLALINSIINSKIVRI